MTMNWYALEYSVMNGLNPYFYRPYALYEVRRACSESNAQAAVSKKYFRAGNGSEYSFQDAFFGRSEEFHTRAEAESCIEHWLAEPASEYL